MEAVKVSLAGLMAIVLLLVIWGAILKVTGSDDPDPDDIRRGFHCLSEWDGSHLDFKQDLISRLNNPDGFEHIETKVTVVDRYGNHSILMKYRARTPFGGIIVSYAEGTFRNATCRHTLTRLQ